MNELRMCRGTWSFCDGNCDKCRTIATASTIDVREVKRGEWHTLWKEELPVCSVCNNISFYKSNYCPNCGARMRGES